MGPATMTPVASAPCVPTRTPDTDGIARTLSVFVLTTLTRAPIINVPEIEDCSVRGVIGVVGKVETGGGGTGGRIGLVEVATGIVEVEIVA